MLDVFDMLEGYCNLLIERIHLIENDRECPVELREAISGLLFTSSRCGEFPELLEIRAVFSTRYGKEFVSRAIELRNNCGVSTKLVQKLSTRQPELENRKKVLKEIADENNIILHLEETSSVSTENVDPSNRGNQQEPALSTRTSGTFGNGEGFSDSMEATPKYKDVAAAAQAAFESAAQAAAAARAAVELSRSDSHDPDNQNSPKTPRRRPTNNHESDSRSKRTSKIKSTSPSKDSEENLISAASSFNEADESHDSNLVMNHSRDEDSSNQIPSNLRSGLETEPGLGPISEKTRQVRGY